MLSRKKTKVWLLLFIILLVLIAAAVFFIVRAKNENILDETLSMASNSERIAFLNKQGWIVKPDPSSELEVILPTEFNETYKDYLDLQKYQGFDLPRFAGQTVEIFSYDVLNYPDFPENITANMIIKDDKLIGGEICYNAEENGWTEPLITLPIAEITENPAVTTVSAVQPTITVKTTVSAVQPTITVTSVSAAPNFYIEDIRFTQE
ncbi:MAG: DUF4830 domain-containing protein [Ruminococcus sp.]|jgi:hypothetical protein|nr:DUF4830 domain-containing protein [Ruminococcus sp.]